jgi:dTDP-4-dehydrorhamnose reductase
MNVLVTGAGGQLGRELMRASWAPGTQVIGADRARLDITDRDAADSLVRALRPDAIINAAAYTAVDSAEDEPTVADAVNRCGVEHLAAAAERYGTRLVHLSTDYVFDGTKSGWYVETDPVSPVGVYARTKEAGEQAARSVGRHLILRTAWVYGALGSNFVRTMMTLGASRPSLRVVHDQVGCPSSAQDLADALVALVQDRAQDDLVGTYHLASPTAATWFEFASAILQVPLATDQLTIEAISTAEYPTAAARPANSRLDSTAIREATGVQLRPWHEALPDVVRELADQLPSRMGVPHP